TITDDAVHCQGLTLDDIQIPQLGFRDDAASDNGWQAEGFIRSPNLLPQQYVLQAVLFPQGSGQPSVTQILVDPRTGAASVAFAHFGSFDHITLAVSALAPATIVPAQYQLTARIE
ncbi:MAG TPA: hypothetical protein VF818_09055, partial [Ktedonobacterales bacterium]